MSAETISYDFTEPTDEELAAIEAGEYVFADDYIPKELDVESEKYQPPTTRSYDNEEVIDFSWQADANCLGVDPDLFFPERGASSRNAKEVCRGCIARLACLEYSLVNNEKFGIWGGLSERERKRLRRQQNQTGR